MRQRKKSSGGQAIVMVSLALFSMAGMMGLAVDLGWSFFTQKAAQAAADDAALSAVQRAYEIIVNQEKYVSQYSTAVCTGTTPVLCTTPGQSIQCNPSLPLSNLQSGCLYARNDGFVPGGHGGRQNVLIEANKPPTLPDSIPAIPGSPRDILYWVTVRVNENIPQLFSALMGHTQGTISAVATAALASKALAGSLYGLNQSGDCFNGGAYCGVDLVGGAGAGNCPTGPAAFICATAGAAVASTCNGTGTGCSGNNNYAGTGSLNGGSGSIDIPVANALDPSGNWTPAPTVTSTVGYQDPTQGEQQPPLAASNPAPSCGISGAIPNNAILGPFQYYHYTGNGPNGLPQPDGVQISLPSTATFAANGTCPGVLSTTGTSQASSAFPMYVFYGGLSTGTGTVTFGAGQYVMAGVATGTPYVLNANQTNLVSAGTASGTGDLFVFTNQNYPGLSSSSTSSPQSSTIPNYTTSAIPTLTYGGVQLSGVNSAAGSELYGIADNTSTGTSNLPANLNGYGGMLFWQDRGNSTVTYDANGNVTTNPATANPNCPAATCTSPQMLISGNVQGLNGVIYQPRGAWMNLAGTLTGSLQLLSGAVIGTGGSATLTALTPGHTLIRYLPVLIQ